MILSLFFLMLLNKKEKTLKGKLSSVLALFHKCSQYMHKYNIFSAYFSVYRNGKQVCIF